MYNTLGACVGIKPTEQIFYMRLCAVGLRLKVFSGNDNYNSILLLLLGESGGLGVPVIKVPYAQGYTRVLLLVHLGCLDYAVVSINSCLLLSLFLQAVTLCE